MSLIQEIETQIKVSMKARQGLRTETLRMVKSALKNKEIENKGELNEEDSLQTLSSLVKQRRESAEAFEKAGREDLAQKENDEIVIIQEFLPQALSEAEIKDLIQKTIQSLGAEGMKDMGKVMGALKSQTTGRADGKLVSQFVKEALA